MMTCRQPDSLPSSLAVMTGNEGEGGVPLLELVVPARKILPFYSWWGHFLPAVFERGLSSSLPV